MLIFLLTFQTIVLCICILSHKMIEKRYKDIEESMKILNDSRAYKTEEKVWFIRGIIDRYKSYVQIANGSIQDKNIELKNMIQVDLLNSRIGRFNFIGVYNLATKVKILMRYSILIEVLILYINNEIRSYMGIAVLITGVGLAILTEIIVIIKAIEKRQETLILTIEEYILYKYEMELGNKVKEARNKEDIHIDETYVDNRLNNDSEANKIELRGGKKNFIINNQGLNKIKDKDIANVIRMINLSRDKKSEPNIPD